MCDCDGRELGNRACYLPKARFPGLQGVCHWAERGQLGKGVYLWLSFQSSVAQHRTLARPTQHHHTSGCCPPSLFSGPQALGAPHVPLVVHIFWQCLRVYPRGPGHHLPPRWFVHWWGALYSCQRRRCCDWSGAISHRHHTANRHHPHLGAPNQISQKQRNPTITGNVVRDLKRIYS